MTKIEICGKCLHNKLMHEPHNGHFMYCAKCNKICELSEYETKHPPTSIEKLMEIRSKLP